MQFYSKIKFGSILESIEKFQNIVMGMLNGDHRTQNVYMCFSMECLFGGVQPYMSACIIMKYHVMNKDLDGS